jgi:hypothetical protein
MEIYDGWRDKVNREEWNLGDDRFVQMAQTNWSQVSVQEENDPTRHNWETQGETHSQRLSAELTLQEKHQLVATYWWQKSYCLLISPNSDYK